MGLSAVMSSGPWGTPRSARRPAIPNLGPGNRSVTPGPRIRSFTLTPDWMDELPNTTLMSCVSSPPADASA